MSDTSIPAPGPLREDFRADVCVVGAGIAGLTTAYLLTQLGLQVVVLDDGPIAGGESPRTTAHLANALDDRYYLLEKLHGEQGARLAAESHTAAIDQIESIVLREAIACDFERLEGYLFVPPGESLQVLEDERMATHRAGLVHTHMVPRAPLPDFDTGPALCFPRQGQFHILKYLAGLSRAIQVGGAHVFSGTQATRIEGGPGARVETAGGATVHARAIVVATNTPVNDRVAIHTKQAPYRTYVIAMPVSRKAVSRALFWDTPDPYHYVRLQHLSAEEDWLIVGGEDHKTGQATDMDERHARLETWTRQRFRSAGPVRYRWSGQVMEPVDGLAYIGKNPMDADNVFIATGDSGNGMTHGTIAGMLISDLITGKENPWAGLYSPSRKPPLRAIKDFAAENLNVAAQYPQLVTPGEVSSVDELARGQGAVMRNGVRKIAAYRDENGVVHQLSAVCVHLGCVVTFNPLEKTWDCPCHGSRYAAADGHPINGPANAPLERPSPWAAG